MFLQFQVYQCLQFKTDFQVLLILDIMSTFRLDLPEVFTGEDGRNFGQWVRRLEVAVEVLPQTERKLHLILPSRLAGAAFTVWESIPSTEQQEYSVVRKKLSAVFGNTNYLTTFKSCIDARKRQQNEVLEVFAAAITTLVEEAFPNYDTAGKDGEKFRRFLAGIDKPLQIRIHEMGATSFNEALDVAVRVERANKLGQPSVATDFTIASTSPKRDATSATLEKVLKRLDELELKLEKATLHQDLNILIVVSNRRGRPVLMTTRLGRVADILMIIGANHLDRLAHTNHINDASGRPAPYVTTAHRARHINAHFAGPPHPGVIHMMMVDLLARNSQDTQTKLTGSLYVLTTATHLVQEIPLIIS